MRRDEAITWLRQDEAGRLLAAAGALHERFGALCTLSSLYRVPIDTGPGASARPRPVHLPPVVVAALANVELVEDRTVFRLSKTGHLYDLLTEAARTAGVTIPERVAFHIFRHTPT